MSARDIYILVLLCILHALGSATSTTCKPTASTLTCPYRTVNYLTHTLAQQCLASSRTGAATLNRTNSSTVTGTPTHPSSTIAHNVTRSGEEIQSKSTLSSSSKNQSSSISISSAPPSSAKIESVTTVTATSVPATVLVPLLPVAADEDSPLESGNFLSFEDWKKQNLIKVGQSEHLGRNARSEQRQPRKRPENVHNSLDSLGDDAEIDIDFSGLVPGNPDALGDRRNGPESQPGEDQKSFEPGHKLQARGRRKDAGTTSKERFNYASFDCAANVLKSNSEAKNANLVLRENKDLYMLNKCSASNKFIILELCDDISIDTVVLANFEFFSSSFRIFHVSVSDRYPVKIDKWKSLGTFEARNTREVQAFLVENPVIWARYIRFEFLSHYGTEFYCPVSLIRVHGTTMLEEYKHDLEANLEDEEDEAEAISSADSVEDKLVPEAVDKFLLADQQQGFPIQPQDAQIVAKDVGSLKVSKTDISTKKGAPISSIATSPNKLSAAYIFQVQGAAEICCSDDETAECTKSPSSHGRTVAENTEVGSLNHVSTTRSSAASSITTEHQPSSVVSKPKTESTASNLTAQRAKQSPSNVRSGTENRKTVSTGAEQQKSNPSSREPTRSPSAKQQGSGTQPQPASPTLQESFFKSVQKRLSMLESNSSLSLQYIEEQSRALRDAFHKVEQRQLSKTSSFLEGLNHTVLSELREFRLQYDQLWQSTVIELEIQRERHQQESQAMNARLGVLADELIFQRRVSILQMVLILVCLGLVLFSRGALNNYMELPLVQSVLSRSPSSRWIGLSGDSQTTSPAMTRTRSAHQLGSKQGILKRHNRGLSEDSNNETLSASELYSPPTPVSFDGYSDAELVKTEIKSEEFEFDPISIERPSTSPPTLPSVEDPTTPRSVNFMGDSTIESRILTPISSDENGYGSRMRNDHSGRFERHLTWDLPD